MKTKQWIALILGLVVSGLASANVVYRWQTVSTSPSIWTAVGEIEITHAARAAGGLNYSAPAHCALDGDASCDNSNAFSPVVRFHFAVNTPTVSGTDVMLNVIDGTGMTFPQSHWFSADLAIDGDTMTGNIYANTGNSDVLISGGVIAFNSDYPGYGCGTTGVCQGASGYWRQVPEPPALALLGLGLLAWAARQRIITIPHDVRAMR